MTSKVIEGHKSSSKFSVNPTLPLSVDASLSNLCGSLSLTLHPVLSSPLFPLLSHAKINLHTAKCFS